MTSRLEIPLEAVLTLVEEFERIDTELEAYKWMFAAFKMAHVPDAQSLDAALVAARRAPLLHEKMKQKYDAVREMLREQELGALGQKKIDQLIERLRPTDPLN